MSHSPLISGHSNTRYLSMLQCVLLAGLLALARAQNCGDFKVRLRRYISRYLCDRYLDIYHKNIYLAYLSHAYISKAGLCPISEDNIVDSDLSVWSPEECQDLCL